jgi:hypothetical protein
MNIEQAEAELRAESLRNGRMIEAETETAEIPIKKTAQVVLPMGSTSHHTTDNTTTRSLALVRRRAAGRHRHRQIARAGDWLDDTSITFNVRPTCSAQACARYPPGHARGTVRAHASARSPLVETTYFSPTNQYTRHTANCYTLMLTASSFGPLP